MRGRVRGQGAKKGGRAQGLCNRGGTTEMKTSLSPVWLTQLTFLFSHYSQNPEGRDNFEPHFRGAKTKAQRGEGSYLPNVLLSYLVLELDLNKLGLCDSVLGGWEKISQRGGWGE